MPGFNQKGPMGEGPMTGCKMGRCTNFGAIRQNQTTQENETAENPINYNFQGQGLGSGLGQRKGRGMGNVIGQGNGMGQNRGGRGMGRSDEVDGGGRGVGRRFRGGIQK